MPNIRENMGLADIVRGSHEDFEILFGLSDGDAVYTSEISPYAQHFIYTRGGEPAELRTADELVQMIAFFYYNAKKPAWIDDKALYSRS
jgi:fructokinase